MDICSLLFCIDFCVTRPIWEKKDASEPLTICQENEDEMNWNLADVDMKVVLISFYELKNIEKVIGLTD